MGQIFGGGVSKPEPVPCKPHIYVTNQTKDVKQIFVRVRGDKLQEKEIYSRILDERSVELSGEGKAGAKAAVKLSNKHEEEKKDRRVYDKLTQGGFNLLPRGETLPFAGESDGRLMYVSVHDGNTMWDIDMVVDPRRYGCVTVKGDQRGISVHPSNPEPHWIECKERDRSFPSGLVKVHRRPDNVPVYMAKIIFRVGERTFDCVLGAWRENGKLCREEDPLLKPPNRTEEVNVLLATGYEWVNAVRGNPIPPNAVKTGFGENGVAHMYLGRINGDKACGIAELDGMFNYFVPLNGGSNTSGEVLLLTAEPTER